MINKKLALILAVTCIMNFNLASVYAAQNETNVVKYEELKEESIDIDTVVKIALRNSPVFEKVENDIKSQYLYSDAYKKGMETWRKLQEFDRLSYLHNITRTSSENEEYERLLSEFKDSFSASGKYELQGMYINRMEHGGSKLFKAYNSKNAIFNSEKLNAYLVYNNVLTLKESFNIQKTMVENIQKNYDAANEKFLLGVISEFELKGIETKLKSEKLSLQKFERNYKLALMKLNKILRQPIDKEFKEYKPINLINYSNIKPLQEYLVGALDNRAEVLDAEEDYKIANAKYEMINKVYAKDTGETKRDATFELENAKNNMEIAKINVQIEINSAYKELERLKNEVEKSKTNCEIAQNEYEAAEIKHSMGSINQIELVEKLVVYKNAQINMKNAQWNFINYSIKMDYASSIGPSIK